MVTVMDQDHDYKIGRLFELFTLFCSLDFTIQLVLTTHDVKTIATTACQETSSVHIPFAFATLFAVGGVVAL